MKKRAIEKKLVNKQKVITSSVGYPGAKDGRDGSITIRRVPGRGLFLFAKVNGSWYHSRLKRFMPRCYIQFRFFSRNRKNSCRK